MKEQDAAALGTSVASCREQMESDLCELFEDLGPVLTQMAIARNETSRDRRERVAAVALQHALPSVWEKVSPSLRSKLKTREVIAATSDYGAAEQPTIRLLSHEEESVHLAMRKVLERITLSCRDETRALDRRLNYLVLRRAMQPRDSTFKIPALWSCIEAACAEVVTDTDALILLLQLIGEQMTAELPQLYRVVNEAMIEADILPRLKRGYRDVIPVDAQEVAEESTRVASILDRLVKARTAEGSASKAPRSAAASGELFRTLQTLQAAPPPLSAGKHTNVVRIARDSDAARDMKPLEAVTLDIVAKLFDLIFSDPKVADGIKALVARLQTTVLRAAMLNQRFFADRSHPARRFLDSITIVAVRWGKVVSEDDPFYLKLAELVDKVQSSYDGDMRVFDSANAELDDFLSEREELEEQQNRALADAVHAREEEMRQRREAQVRIQKLADACIDRVQQSGLPIEIREFLRRAVLTDKQLQATSLPALASRINAGFDEIGSTPSERKAFMDTLIELQLAALRSKKHVARKATEATTPGMRGAGPTLQVSYATGNGVRVQDISLPTGGGSTQKTRRTVQTFAGCVSWCGVTGWTSLPQDRAVVSACPGSTEAERSSSSPTAPPTLPSRSRRKRWPCD